MEKTVQQEGRGIYVETKRASTKPFNWNTRITRVGLERKEKL